MRTISLVSALALSIACLAVPATAQQAPANPSAAAGVHTDLPRVAHPSHYAISITPDATNLTFTGTSSVDLEVTEASPVLTLHALDLKIASATLTPAGGAAMPVTVTMDAASQTARFAAAQPLAPGKYRLDTTYSGVINTQANGLFALDYPDKVTGKDVRGLFTQFEAPDARRFAPMFDEPIYKATFDLSAVVPSNRMAISNMPTIKEEDLGKGLKRVTFGTSPKMSSYLLFFALGDFERMAKEAAPGVQAGIVAPRGSGEQPRFALDELAPLIPYYSEYFGQPYPLPKLDNVAAPGQSQFFSAMENWGAILTFERILLNDPAITSASARQNIVTTQAHEVAHQWFGNLVTMAWWEDLWLNEGFASWMETKATAHFHPDWFPLLGRVEGREAAMGLDGFKTTHPIVQEIKTVDETNQAFDAITYQKGEAVISMLESFAGETVWRDGLRAYMRDHKFANTRSRDLWQAVEKAGAPGLTSVATDFTTKPGIPLVKVTGLTCRKGVSTVMLEQGEFSIDRKDQVAGQPQQWKVPLLVSAGGEATRTILDGGKGTVTVNGCGPVVINAGQLGYYRSLYTPKMLASLKTAMPSLQPVDQMGLIADNLALSTSGYQPYAPALDLLAAVPGNANPVVASSAFGRYVGAWRTLEKDPATQKRLAAKVAATWKPRLMTLGFDPKANESLPDADLRSTLISGFGTMGDPDVVAEARRRFAMLASNPKALDGPQKTTWLNIVARNATKADWDAIRQMAAASNSAVERQFLYTLLGRPADPALAAAARDLALTDVPGKTTSAAMIVAAAGLHPDATYDFAVANRAKIEGLVDAQSRVTFIASLANASNDPAMLAKLEAFKATVPAEASRPVDRVIGGLTERAKARPLFVKGLTDWLNARKK
ncbi:peptidase M1, membrane alanine aminopeptidase [Novosphingobium aromaticivorans DSM 12444]|uniref:Aminopeptidase n=1 Tax=Novosphingobium aromaticivorans (strain ATCC 700278 / DSM 12444 / CCUG 56034 / CIP 105152 / NBRC 16084 / F199) TaxID=279238 RepID=Q2GB82_NOVAD|nr:M1 family metallopeptidase [Novosphingobium aromaticivorans]ABD24891.1 peptidase M1, membrane alanine aminopeptidase [Novosphingobium aromaticivorans DSM 12444]SCY14396.1 aminopeptidase N [Novosphingobium aromaticivorans]